MRLWLMNRNLVLSLNQFFAAQREERTEIMIAFLCAEHTCFISISIISRRMKYQKQKKEHRYTHRNEESFWGRSDICGERHVCVIRWRSNAHITTTTAHAHTGPFISITTYSMFFFFIIIILLFCCCCFFFYSLSPLIIIIYFIHIMRRSMLRCLADYFLFATATKKMYLLIR